LITIQFSQNLLIDIDFDLVDSVITKQ